jgi:hypothetical protein
MLNALLDAGYSVLAVYMPHQAQFDIDADDQWEVQDESPGHNTMFSTLSSTVTGSVIRYFLEPTAASLNYLKTQAVAHGFPQYLEYNMAGISGGGWTTTLYAAVDPTIKISIDIAGSLPLYMRWSVVSNGSVINEGDEEQLHDALYTVAGYLDLYVLASTGAGRYHLQLLSYWDPCCFGGNAFWRPDASNYLANLAAYQTSVQQAAAAIGFGGFRLDIDQTDCRPNCSHAINYYQLYSQILPTLGPTIAPQASIASPSAAGVPITWTTNIVQSGLSPLEHQFWLYSSDGWRIVKDYSASNTFTWTPAEAGTYYLQARVRLAGSTIPYHGWGGGGTTTINPPAAVSISSFTSNVSFPQPAGAAVTFTTTASGGVGPLQYQFWLQDPISGYSIVREYSSTNTYTWTPLRPGNYTMHIWVRSAGSTAAWQAVSSSGSFTVNGVVPYVLSLTADKPLPVAVNTPLVWTAQAARGTTPLEYQFWRGGTTGKTLVQDYRSSATYSWTPTTTDNWVYLEVWVRLQGSTASAASLVSSAFQVVSGPVQMVSFTVNQVFPSAARTPIVWTTRSTGGTAPLQYKFLLYDRTTAVWTTAQDWSANPQFAWTPARSEFGVHAVQVYVRSTGSTAEYEAHFAPGFFGITP